MSDKNLPDAPAARRNRAAILEVLRTELADAGSVLEIGAGTGQHAAYFAAELPALSWQPSDRIENVAGISAWVASSGLSNLSHPVVFDVLEDGYPTGHFDAVFSANTAHIMSWEAVCAMFRACGKALPKDGTFCLYGPFNLNGAFTSQSNEQFDCSLRRQNAAMGIRDLDHLVEIADQQNLSLARRYAMPANNQLLVWKKVEERKI